MRRFTVTPETLVLGWCVQCDGRAVGSHFTQGLAIADARLQEHSARRRAARG